MRLKVFFYEPSAMEGLIWTGVRRTAPCLTPGGETEPLAILAGRHSGCLVKREAEAAGGPVTANRGDSFYFLGGAYQQLFRALNANMVQLASGRPASVL